MSVISTRFFNSLKHKPKVLKCSRTLRGVGGEALIPKGECFLQKLQIKIDEQIFRDRVVIINNLTTITSLAQQYKDCIMQLQALVLQVGHFLSVNGQMVVQSIPTPTIEPVIKNKGKIKINPHFITIVSVKNTL